MALAYSGNLNRIISGSSEALTTTIDGLQLPFETELKKYVKADDENVNSLITNMKNLLNDLKNLTISMVTLLLDPAAYDSAFTNDILTSLETIVNNNLTAAGTGLPTATEAAIWNRARDRATATGNRGLKRVVTEIAKRLP
jgi:hypothetical protein